MPHYYDDSLVATALLLQKVKATYWHKWLKKDLEIWRESKETERHLSAYAGCPGAFDDLIITEGNGHRVTPENEAQIHLVFHWLRNLCFYFANIKVKKVSFENLLKAFSLKHSAFKSIKKDTKLFKVHYELINFHGEISGERCLDCGYAIIPETNLDHYILENIIPSWVLWACVNHKLVDLVNQTLKWQRTELQEIKNELKDCILQSNIEIRESIWSKKCPACKSKDHAAYRWKLRKSANSKFFPSKDNIKLNVKSI